LADLARAHRDLHRLGYHSAALSVLAPERAADLARRLELPFPLLCDPDRSASERLGVLDPDTLGGVTRPALWVIGPDRRILLARTGTWARRVKIADLLAWLRDGASPGTAEPTPRTVILGPLDPLRAGAAIARHGLVEPRPDPEGDPEPG
jgi:peroxiredoxin